MVFYFCVGLWGKRKIKARVESWSGWPLGFPSEFVLGGAFFHKADLLEQLVVICLKYLSQIFLLVCCLPVKVQCF